MYRPAKRQPTEYDHKRCLSPPYVGDRHLLFAEILLLFYSLVLLTLYVCRFMIARIEDQRAAVVHLVACNGNGIVIIQADAVLLAAVELVAGELHVLVAVVYAEVVASAAVIKAFETALCDRYVARLSVIERSGDISMRLSSRVGAAGLDLYRFIVGEAV